MMKLSGIIEINGIICSATVDINDGKKYTRPRAYQAANGKWRAYKTINGVQKAFGSHDTKEQALDAARKELQPSRKSGDALGLYVRPENGMCRVILTIAGNRVRLGEYATWGHAVLVRDVVARRSGMKAHVRDYEMPLALVTNAVARSYIRDAVPVPTASELERYSAYVDELNRSRGVDVASTLTPPRLDMLPSEMWRVKQPSVTGHRV